MRYADASRRTQVRRLGEATRRALAHYGMEDAALRLLCHEFNTTFRVTTSDGRRAALRVNVNSTHDVDGVAAEAEWVAAIAAETAVRVAEPILTLDGRLATFTTCEGIDGPLAMVMYQWLGGRDLGSTPTRRQLEALGAAMARLHDHTHNWPSTRIGNRPMIGAPLMGEPDLTIGNPRLTAPQRSVIAAARAQIDEATTSIFAGTQQLIHADLHGWNARWHDKTLTVFDFDDCGVGTALQDLAIAAYYLRGNANHEAALRRGYEAVRPLPDHDPAQYEALIAERNIVLLLSVIDSNNAAMRNFLPDYATQTVRRLRRYLRVGRFEL